MNEYDLHADSFDVNGWAELLDYGGLLDDAVPPDDLYWNPQPPTQDQQVVSLVTIDTSLSGTASQVNECAEEQECRKKSQRFWKPMEQESVTGAKKVWDSVKHYVVRCDNCWKWRVIPTKEKYEEIRAVMGEKAFYCETAREWRPAISCEDDADIEDDENMCWAMDRPRIPQTPHGWQRILRIRAEGGTKFADVYYVAPSNKRFRSMVELTKYIDHHPEYNGVSLSQFSFQSPVPLDDNYIAKRPAYSSTRLTPLAGESNIQTQNSSGVAEAAAGD